MYFVDGQQIASNGLQSCQQVHGADQILVGVWGTGV